MPRIQSPARPSRFTATAMPSAIAYGTRCALRDTTHFGAPDNRLVGTAAQIAERPSAGPDGISLINFISHEMPGSRKDLSAQGDRLPARHEAARCRGALSKAVGPRTGQGALA
jgi:hypothetical protein